MRVIVVDDDAIVAMSMQTILAADAEIEVVALGNDGADAIELYEKYLPDVLVTDIQMQRVSGLEAAEKIMSKHPDARIILLTTFLDDEYVSDALKIGARGYILKQDFAGVVPAIKAVYSGQNVFGKEFVSKIPTLVAGNSDEIYASKGITDKELDIIKLVAKGLSNKEIATELYLGEGTVRNYLSTILEKLELRDRTQLAVFYLNGGRL